MCKLSTIALSIVSVMIISLGTSIAQQSLKKYSQEQEVRWRAGRVVAESIATANAIPIRFENAEGRITELQRFEKGIPRIFMTYNLTSSKTISSNKVWPGGGFGFSLSGSTETLGEWDGGAVLATHQEFGGRVISTQGASAGHATHVAGTMIAAGVNPSAHGMSYAANLQSFDWNNDVGEMASAASSGLRVSNHSYGLITGWTFNLLGDNKWVWFGDTTISGTQDYRFGFYDAEAQSWDDVAFNAPYYLIDKAAGNDRGEGPSSQPVVHWIFNSQGQQVSSNRVRNIDGNGTGYRTLNGASTSKNVLVVGAVNGITAGYQQPSDVVMSSFSCWGPTNDGRIKPDIVADGVGLFSSWWVSNAVNNNYATASGTSMATPSVTGSVGLLLHHQRNLHGNNPLRASTMRALLLHTADDAGNTGPDYSFGWGLMNTLHAAQLMSLDSTEGPNSHITEFVLSQGQTKDVTVYSDGTKPLKATICWTDPSHSPPAPSLNPTTIMLVNDIDLRAIRQSDATTYMPWVLDPSVPSAPATTGDNIRDNVEQVVVSATSPGAYTLRITHKGSLSGGSQVVSLIFSGNVSYYRSVMSVLPASGNYSLSPVNVVPESLKVRNSGNLTLDYTSSGLSSWLVIDTATHHVLPADSAYLHFSINAGMVSQWSTYHDTITVVSNDTAHSPVKVPVTLTTSGPKIIESPSILTIDTDSGLIASSKFMLHSTGTIPLTFTVTDNDSVPRPWLSIIGDTGTIAVGDSFLVKLKLDASTLSPGVYNASLEIASNDSLTGDVSVSVVLNVFSGLSVVTGMHDNWNLISVPVTPSNNLKTHLYPTATSNAFAYTGGYVVNSSLTPGTGYWLRFSGNQDVSVNGLRILIDSIDVFTGWNLIGSISYPVPVVTITANPPGMITSKFFGFSGIYTASDTIVPGQGYWVKTSQDGFIILNSEQSTNPAGRIQIVPISELPPSPPAGNIERGKIPTQFVLEEAYPNPFNPVTTIKYQLPSESHVSLKIYNLMGQVVNVPVNQVEDAGYKSIEWNAGNTASGIYLYVLQATSVTDPGKAFTQVKKLVLLK
jgi:hypothetical protein